MTAAPGEEVLACPLDACPPDPGGPVLAAWRAIDAEADRRDVLARSSRRLLLTPTLQAPVRCAPWWG